MVARKSDIVLIVCQNNDEQMLIIDRVHDAEEQLADVLGYVESEMVGQMLPEFLGKQAKQNLSDYLEYNDTGNDLSAVLHKTREFSMVAKSGDEVLMSMRIERSSSPDSHARFAMVLIAPDQRKASGLDVLKVLKQGESLDEETHLATCETFMEEADIIHFYVGKKETKASISIVEVDDFVLIVKDHGEETGKGLLQEVVLRCRQTFRSDDMLGYLGQGKFGVVLPGASKTPARIPLNRLRAHLANQPLYIPGNKSEIGTLSIAYTEIQPGEGVKETVARCEETLKKHVDNTNQLLEV